MELLCFNIHEFNSIFHTINTSPAKQDTLSATHGAYHELNFMPDITYR